MILLLMAAAQAADQTPEEAVRRVRRTYTVCQKRARDVSDPRALSACTEASDAVQAALEAIEDRPGFDSVASALKVYDDNLDRALSVMRRAQADPISNVGAMVVAIESDETHYSHTVYFERRGMVVRPPDVPVVLDACAQALHYEQPLEVRVWSNPLEGWQVAAHRAKAVSSILIECGVPAQDILVDRRWTLRDRRAEIGEQRLLSDVPHMGQ